MWLLSVIGIELGYHRYFSHKAFQATTALKSLLVILASMSGQGSVLAWSTNHVHHHRYSDQPQDTHTPMHSGNNGFGKLKGFWHSQVLWKWSYIPPFPTKKVEWLYQDKQIVQLSKWYYLWVALGLILPAMLSGLWDMSPEGFIRGFLLGGIIRLFICQQGTFLINSACHLIGKQPYDTNDNSRNISLLSLPTLGGSWHNNHHAFPGAANNSHHRWQPDPGYWILLLWQHLGWASKLRTTDTNTRQKRLKDLKT